MSTCRATVSGRRAGEKCLNSVSEANPFCGRHQRNYQHEQLVAAGKIPCSKFFRGCDATVDRNGMCADCLVKYRPKSKVANCGHTDCAFKTSGSKYCGKHTRDEYIDLEKEQGIKYCDIARGCFTVCEAGYTKCEPCRETSYSREKATREERMTIHNAIEQQNGIMQVCVNCGRDYEQFLTRYNKPSKLCLECNGCNLKQDRKREARSRNFKAENFKNMDRYFKEYIASATRRDLPMNLQADEFKALIILPCHYCGYLQEAQTNGIDRINNDIGYEKSNCVTCCETCNRMKHYFHPTFFIKLCHIFNGAKPSKDFYKDWPEYYGRSNNHNYTNYKRTVETKRKIQMELTQDDWDKLTRQPCYLCGFRSAKGIGLDRVDNSQRVYRLDNVKPCCGTCNDIKSIYTLETLRTQAGKISANWPTTTAFDCVPRIKNPMRDGGGMDIHERVHWKATAIYYDILSDTHEFYEANKTTIDAVTYEELKKHCKD